MIDHEVFKEMLGARRDLLSGEGAILDSHLDGCDTCQEIAAEYDRQDVFLHSLAIPEPVRSVRQVVLRRVQQRVFPGLHLRHTILTLVPATLIAAVILVALARSHAPAHSVSAPALRFGPQSPAATANQQGADSSLHKPAGRKSAPTAPMPGAVPASPLRPPLRLPYRVDTTVKEVQLSLIAPRHSYPRNAVIPVEVRITNHSHRLVQIQSWALYSCAQAKPNVEAVDSHGNPVSPLPPGLILECPFPVVTPRTPGFLRPEQSLTFHQYVVLITPRVLINTELIRYSRCDPRVQFPRPCRGDTTQVQGRVSTFRLIPSRPPHAALLGSPPAVIELRSAPNPRALLWYSGWFVCSFVSTGGTLSGGESFRDIGGSPTHGSRASLGLPNCAANDLTLHLVAGWVNGPVAFVSHVKGQERGAVAHVLPASP